MSEMKDMILEVAERMLKEHVDKELVDILEEGKWAKDLWNLFIENGMEIVAISEENGGAGGDLEDLLNIVRLTGKYATPIPFLETTLANTILECVNLTPVTGIATVNISIDEVLTLDGNFISGKVNNIPWARYVDHFVTIANDVNGLQIVVVDLENAKILPSSNLASEPRDTVVLKNVEVKQVSNLLTDDQLKYLNRLVTAFQLAAITGAIEKINDLTIQYSKEREQFGRPIHRFQLVQQHLVQLVGENAIMQAAFHNLTDALLKGNGQFEVAYAWLRAEEAIALVTSLSHQVHAAIGTTYEYALQQYTRRLWSWRDEGVGSEYWKEQIAENLLHFSGDNVWDFLTSNKGNLKI